MLLSFNGGYKVLTISPQSFPETIKFCATACTFPFQVTSSAKATAHVLYA